MRFDQNGKISVDVIVVYRHGQTTPNNCSIFAHERYTVDIEGAVAPLPAPVPNLKIAPIPIFVSIPPSVASIGEHLAIGSPQTPAVVAFSRTRRPLASPGTRYPMATPADSEVGRSKCKSNGATRSTGFKSSKVSTKCSKMGGSSKNVKVGASGVYANQGLSPGAGSTQKFRAIRYFK